MSNPARASRAVVLAAGRGTRMQEPDPGVGLTPEQAAAADAGLKMLVPIHGRPFLAYVLHELAEAGITDVCLVVGPGDDPVRVAVEAMPLERIRPSFAVQAEPRGSAHALLAAEPVLAGSRGTTAAAQDDAPGSDTHAGGASRVDLPAAEVPGAATSTSGPPPTAAPFLVLNADNVYSAAALRAVAELEGSGLAGYDADALVARSNVTPEQVAAFALIEVDDGHMDRIVEKPDPATALAMDDVPVSMTLWKFEASIFDACRDIEPSERGELELVDAVSLAIDRGTRFRVVPVHEGVLDISRRRDIPEVERWLRDVEPRP